MATREELDNHFKSRNVRVVRFPDQDTVEFSTLEQFDDFMTKERDFWASCREGAISEIHSHFHSIVVALDAATKEGNVQQWTHHLNNAISRAQQGSFPCVYSSTPIAQLIKERYLQNRQQADAICQYIFKNSINQMGNKNFFEGYLYAFLVTQFAGGVDQKLKAEEQALADLRAQYTEELSLLHNDYLTRGDDCTRKSAELDGKYVDFCKTMTGWKADMQEGAETLLKDKRKELEELKVLHKEQLRLKEPATHWSKLEEEYQKKGKEWRTWLIVSASLFLVFLVSVLFNLPDAIFPSQGFTLIGFKSAVLIMFIASVGIYVLHFFTKMSLSAYHMARDAKERYQLTHVYLSLMHEGAVTEAERVIILQSIFSRADTGLLKGDGGPTFPEGIVGGAFKNIKPQ